MNLKYLLFISACLYLQVAQAQKAWLDPSPIDPEDSVTLYINIAACDCQKLAGTTEQVYLWTWEPADPVGAGGNGSSWNSSNEAMAMTKHEGDTWKYKFIPTELYGKTKDEIYNHGKIKCLAKLKDGGGGGSCELESKTEDLEITIERPANPARKVYSFPAAYMTDYNTKDTLKTTSADVFTILYDNKLEAKATMQNINTAYLFIKATGSDGVIYKSSNTVAAADNTDKTKMTLDAETRIFSFTFIPDTFMEVPEGVHITDLNITIITEGFVNSNQAVDGEFKYALRCD
jgi:hypothetical protein